MGFPSWGRVVAVSGLLAVLAAAAVAQEQAPVPRWEAGTSLAQRDAAHRLFTEGNEHFVKRRYREARDSYRKALALFDHPRIRLGLVRALIWLGRPDEAHEHLSAALRFGSAPFDAEEYAEALDYRASLHRQLGILVITCGTSRAVVTLDGHELMTCPATVTRHVMPGRHQVVGRRPGYLTRTDDLVIEPARRTELALRLETLASAAVVERRWPAWLPWSVVGGGALVVAAGLPLQQRAERNMDLVRARVDSTCAGAEGCAALPDATWDLESRARRQNREAVALFAVGTAGMVAGLVLLYVNREQTVIADQKEAAVSLAPTTGESSLGVALTGQF